MDRYRPTHVVDIRREKDKGEGERGAWMKMVWVWLELLELGPALRSPQMRINRLGATLEVPSILIMWGTKI